jgi:hypothetical protein
VTIVIIVFSQINFLILAIFLHVIFRNTCVVKIRALSFMVGGFFFSHFFEEERGVMVVIVGKLGKKEARGGAFISLPFATKVIGNLKSS